MRIINPSFEIMDTIDFDAIAKKIEVIGRTCYKSENRITPESSTEFVNMICNVKKHHSVLEHHSISVRFIANRGFTHEMVRHRLASFSQESTRYVNYVLEKNGSEITCINPFWIEPNSAEFAEWKLAMVNADASYHRMVTKVVDGGLGMKPEDARGVLPIDVKTEIVVTANLREWMHILTLRPSPQAHKSMQELMRPLLEEFKQRIPIIFDKLVTWTPETAKAIARQNKFDAMYMKIGKRLADTKRAECIDAISKLIVGSSSDDEIEQLFLDKEPAFIDGLLDDSDMSDFVYDVVNSYDGEVLY